MVHFILLNLLIEIIRRLLSEYCEVGSESFVCLLGLDNRQLTYVRHMWYWFTTSICWFYMAATEVWYKKQYLDNLFSLNIQIKLYCCCACCLSNGFYCGTQHYLGLFTKFKCMFCWKKNNNKNEKKNIFLLVFFSWFEPWFKRMV